MVMRTHLKGANHDLTTIVLVHVVKLVLTISLLEGDMAALCTDGRLQMITTFVHHWDSKERKMFAR